MELLPVEVCYHICQYLTADLRDIQSLERVNTKLSHVLEENRFWCMLIREEFYFHLEDSELVKRLRDIPNPREFYYRLKSVQLFFRFSSEDGQAGKHMFKHLKTLMSKEECLDCHHALDEHTQLLTNTCMLLSDSAYLTDLKYFLSRRGTTKTWHDITHVNAHFGDVEIDVALHLVLTTRTNYVLNTVIPETVDLHRFTKDVEYQVLKEYFFRFQRIVHNMLKGEGSFEVLAGVDSCEARAVRSWWSGTTQVVKDLFWALHYTDQFWYSLLVEADDMKLELLRLQEEEKENVDWVSDMRLGLKDT